MANGDAITQTADYLHVKLQDTISATDNGVWINTCGYAAGTIHFTLAGTATCQVYGSNAATIPAVSTHADQIGIDINGSQLVTLAVLPRWIKVRISAWTSGATSAIATLRRIAAN